MPPYSRRRLLGLGSLGVGALLAGCQRLDAVRSPDTETRVVVRNHDPSSPHQLQVRLFDPDADDRSEAKLATHDAALDPADSTEDGVEAGPGATSSFRVESRPYLVRVYVNRSEFDHDPYHFHYRPCHSDDSDELDELFVTVRGDETGEAGVYFSAFC